MSGPSAEPFLEMKAVAKSYGQTEVLRDIHLSLAKGEFVAIVGCSGSGKSTLVSILAGLVAPDSGSVRLDGRAVTSPGPERALVFQNYSLLPWMTAYENIALAVDQVFRPRPREERRARVEKYLGLVKLSDARDKRPLQLSGGMRQRVALARALATEPEVLLMDEPLGALDALTRATLQREIERIWEKDRRTVLLITNDVDEGILLADRIIPLSAGPGATLGPSFEVAISRPRDRRALNHDPRFKEIRKGITEVLLAGRKPAARPEYAGIPS